MYLGWQQRCSEEEFRRALANGTVEQLLHRVTGREGDVFFLPSGRIHAIGAGNLIIEIQQNSDTTFRVFDWNRVDAEGKSRQLHIEEAVACIDFNDCTPNAVVPDGETLVSSEFFNISQWPLAPDEARLITTESACAVIVCLTGAVTYGSTRVGAGALLLVPAAMNDNLRNVGDKPAALLHITMPRC